MVLEIINNFLFKQELFAIDLILIGLIITVGGALIIFLLGKIAPAITKTIKKTIKYIFEFIAKMNRFRKRQIISNDYENIEARLKRGGKLRWYEKVAFNEAKMKHEEEIRKAAEKLGLNINEISEKLNVDFKEIAGRLDFKLPQIPQMPQIKEFPHRKGSEGKTRNRENI